MSHDETKLLSAACALQTHQTASRGTKNFKLRDLEFSDVFLTCKTPGMFPKFRNIVVATLAGERTTVL